MTASTQSRSDGVRVAGGADTVVAAVGGGGRDRSVLVVLPHDVPADDPRVLALVLHGAGGTARTAAVETGFGRLARERGWRVAFPEGLAGRWHPWPQLTRRWADPPDDVAFLRAALAHLTERYAVTSIVVSGFSLGAMMAYRLGLAAPEVVSVVAPVGGTAPVLAPPADGRRRPACVHVHGALDDVVPVSGALRWAAYSLAPVRTVLHSWAAGLDRPVDRERAPDGVEVWTGPYGRAELVVDPACGHRWPGGRRLGPHASVPAGTLDATALIADRVEALVERSAVPL